jgi:hypothetical protein
MTIAPSLNESNTYFIFRENGVEVKVIINNRKIFSSRFLRAKERAYINTHFIKGMRTPSFYKKLNKLNQSQKDKLELEIEKLLK